MSKSLIIRLAVFSFLINGLFAGDLKVKIVNGTLNTPGFADRVVLMDLSQGMAELASVNSVNGTTTFTGINADGQSQYLIQAHVGSVTYSTTLVPAIGQASWDATVTVYDSREDVTNLATSVPFFVIYAFEERLYVQKRLIIENHTQPPVTFVGSPGVVKVHIPENVTELDYVTFKNGSMPLKTQMINTEDGQFIPNAVKPGQSEIDIAYYLPFESSSTVVSETVNYDIDHFHVYVMPLTMKISTPGLTREGTDQENGLAIYAIQSVKAGTTLDFKISGEGMSETEPQHQHTTGQIVVEHRMDADVEYILAGILITSLIFALLLSLSQQGANLKEESTAQLNSQKQSLLKEYAALSSKDENSKEATQVMQRLISIYKTLDRIK